ncbi:MAG: HEAT repeat domain-containing protein, partial [Promethearchaeota archaeon]
MDLSTLVNIIITVLFNIIMILVFIRNWKSINQELRTAPNYTIFQKLKNKLSALIYSTLVAITVFFVMALVSSVLAYNSIKVIQLTNPGSSGFIEILEAFQFPNYLPFALIIFTIFALFYPFFEYMIMAGPSQEGPMEVQKWIEAKFIDRVNRPFSYGVAFLLFLFIVILAPTITSIVALRNWALPFNITRPWVVRLIFMEWLLLGPIFYLDYYANIGIAQSFFRGRRINKKKDKKYAIFYYLSIFIMITSAYSFISYIPILWGNFPDPTFQDFIEGNNDFINTLYKIIRFFNPHYVGTNLRYFLMIVPIDFLFFMITGITFALYGFYSKFLNKEPLNSGKMALFAGYIICGIAFSIFVNTMIRWPWVFPDKSLGLLGLKLDLAHPQLHPGDSIFVARIFSISILIDKTLNMVFLLNFLFRRKDLRKNADEWALNRAIRENDFDTILKNTIHQDPNIRMLVATSLVRFLKLKENEELSPELSKNIATILDTLLLDEDPKIVAYIKKHQRQILLKLDNDSILVSLLNLTHSTNPKNIKQASFILNEVSKRNFDQSILFLKELIKSSPTLPAINEISNFLIKLDKKNHLEIKQLTFSYLSPQIAQTHPNLIKGILHLISYSSENYENDFDELSPLFNTLLQHPDSSIVAKTLETYSILGKYSAARIATIMTEFNKITITDAEVIRQKIGAVVKFCNSNPTWFKDLFGYIKIYFEQSNPEFKADAALALGSISGFISIDVFMENIFPLLKILVHNNSVEVRKATFTSMIIIAKTREDILQNEPFQHLFGIMMIDENVELRHQVFRFITQVNPEFLLSDIAAVLSGPLSLQIRVDLLNILATIADKIAPIMQEVRLLDLLMHQSFAKERVLKIEEIEELQEDKSHLFGFQENINKLNLIGATLALIYDICYFAPKEFNQVENFCNSNTMKGGDLALAKMFEFYIKISLAELESKQDFGIGINLETSFQKINKNLYIANPMTQNIIVDGMNKIYQKDKKYHNQIIEILYAISIQKAKPDPETAALLLRLIAKIISDHPETYFKEQGIKDYTSLKEIKINAFNEVFKPLLKKNLNSQNIIIQEGVSASLFSILEASGQEEMVRKLLFNAIQSKEPNTKISAMKALVSLPIMIEDKETKKILLKQLYQRNPEVKAQAIDSLGRIIRTYPTIEKNQKDKTSRQVKSLIYHALYNQYNIKAERIVKQAILAQMETIALVQPHFPICLSILNQLCTDSNRDIAINAERILFSYADLYPEKIEKDIMVIFRHLANSPFIEINELLIKKLLQLNNTQVNLENFLPTLLKLVSSPFTDVRTASIQAFQLIYLSKGEDFNFSLKKVFKLAQNRSVDIRRDACDVLCKVSIDHSDLCQENTK